MSKPQTILGLAFPILRLAELAAYPQINWRKIAISLIDMQKGEEKAQACDIACLQHLGQARLARCKEKPPRQRAA
jgi:hypothetical protein